MPDYNDFSLQDLIDEQSKPLAALLWVKNRVNISTAKCFVLFAVMDTGMYFWNYKTTDYGYVYSWYVVFWLLIHFGPKIADFLWQHLKHWGRP